MNSQLSSNELLHGLDPFEDRLAELLDALFLLVHGSRLPDVSSLRR
jgi:hypothetical protein